MDAAHRRRLAMKLRPEQATFVSIGVRSAVERTLVEVTPVCPARPRLVPGVRIGQYELREKLGEGGMATVYLARDLRLDRDVALKIADNTSAELTQRFLAEAQITARCRHVNIVVIYEVGEHQGSLYMALEYLQGSPLAKLVENHGRLPYPRVVEILVPLLRALQHIHDIGIVHRDLKPDNIFITQQGMPKLLDFGIAKPAEAAVIPKAALTRAGGFVGTPECSAPEQWLGAPIDPRTDIWACGVLLHRLICGRHPLFSLDPVEFYRFTIALERPMPSMRESAPPGVPLALIDVVDRCLFKVKDYRWQSADDLQDALMSFLPGYGPDGDCAPSAVPSFDVPAMANAPVEAFDDAPIEVLPVDDASSKAAVVDDASVERPAVDDASVGTPPVDTSSDTSPLHQVAPPSRPCDAPALVLARDVRVEEPVYPVRTRDPDPRASDNRQPSSSPAKGRKLVILCLATDALETGGSGRLAQQAHAIGAEIDRAGARDRFEIKTLFASEPLDLLRFLRNVRAVIVYFVGSGHEITDGRHGQHLVGNRFGGLYFRDKHGAPLLLTASVMAETFAAAGRSVRLAVLNGCYARIQANALLSHVDCVAGTEGTSDPDGRIAIAYATGLFGGIGERESVATAHRQGCAAISLLGLSGGPRPQLDVQKGIDAERLVLADL